MLSARIQAFQEGMLRVCRGQFPKRCAACGKAFPTFADFVKSTRPLSPTTPETVEGQVPYGLLTFANCACGNTMALECMDPTGEDHRAFLEALVAEVAGSGRTVGEVLEELRTSLRLLAAERPGEPG